MVWFGFLWGHCSVKHGWQVRKSWRAAFYMPTFDGKKFFFFSLYFHTSFCGIEKEQMIYINLDIILFSIGHFMCQNFDCNFSVLHSNFSPRRSLDMKVEKLESCLAKLSIKFVLFLNSKTPAVLTFSCSEASSCLYILKCIKNLFAEISCSDGQDLDVEF